MDNTQLIHDLSIDVELDNKKTQTEYKIKYITEYTLLWLLVNINRKEIRCINFIDCMCNAGIYSDGDFCTSIEVYNLFCKKANEYPNIKFNLFLNDKDKKRVETIKQIIESRQCTANNISVFYENKDVNEYLVSFSLFDKYFINNCATILFVDPYDFRTVVIDKLAQFVERYYCEVIFNLFTSDFVRNGIDNGIAKCIGNANIKNKGELIEYVVSKLKVGKMKYVFPYEFRTRTNTEIYQIIFCTPNVRGLEKLKEALWKVFDGKKFYRNTPETEQMCLFTQTDERNFMLDTHSYYAKEILIKKFSGKKCVKYDQISSFLIESTMMQESQFLRYVLIPLIDEGAVIKHNIAKKNNYKKDIYTFI